RTQNSRVALRSDGRLFAHARRSRQAIQRYSRAHPSNRSQSPAQTPAPYPQKQTRRLSRNARRLTPSTANLTPQPIGNPAFAQIVRRHFQSDAVPHGKSNEVFAHFSRKMGQ